MANSYSKKFKAMVVSKVKEEHRSTSKVAEEFGVPLKTLENWITAFNKDSNCFVDGYMTQSQQIEFLKRKVKDLEIDNEILKKTIVLISKKK